jgi:hypothetical protein
MSGKEGIPSLVLLYIALMVVITEDAYILVHLLT